MAIVCFILGLIILGIALFFAVKNRFNTQKWTGIVLTGIFFSSFFMVFPTVWTKEGQSVTTPALYRLTSALFYSFKSIGGKPELSQLESMPLPTWMKYVYIVLNEIAFFVAPILASGFLLSLFGDMGEKIKFLFRFSEKCRVFSELNEHSLALAKSAEKGTFQETLVFCNTKGADKRLAEEARSVGAVLLYKHVTRMKESIRFRKYEYDLMAENENENLKSAEILIEKTKTQKKRQKPVTVNAFTREDAAIRLLESMAGSSDTFQIRFINEIELFCNQLLYRHPLYDLPEGRKDVSAVIAGCGELGLQLLKTVVRTGQIEGHSLKIRVYDRQADRIKSIFFRQCPELKTLGADLEFIRSDVETDSFLEAIRESADATFVVVATDSDELNLRTAESLYRFFRKESGFTETPPVFARVRNEETTKVYRKWNPEYLKERNIHLFGTIAALFSERTLFDTELERLALAAHLCYQGVLGKPSGSEEVKKATRAFYGSYYDRRSSMATVLCFPAALIAAGIDVRDQAWKSEEALSAFEEKILEPETLERLTKNEHVRWNYFMATEGYERAAMEDVRKYYEETKSHKDDKTKLHPCIIPFEDLQELSEAYRELSGKTVDFIEYDRMIVEHIPEMVRFAKKN